MQRIKLTTNTLVIELEDAKGQAVQYQIREMVAIERDRYMDQIGDRMQLGMDGKVAAIKKFEGMQADLLARCLYDHKGELVARETIQGWPATAVSELFRLAQETNKLVDTAEKTKDAIKKD